MDNRESLNQIVDKTRELLDFRTPMVSIRDNRTHLFCMISYYYFKIKIELNIIGDYTYSLKSSYKEFKLIEKKYSGLSKLEVETHIYNATLFVRKLNLKKLNKKAKFDSEIVKKNPIHSINDKITDILKQEIYKVENLEDLESIYSTILVKRRSIQRKDKDLKYLIDLFAKHKKELNEKEIKQYNNLFSLVDDNIKKCRKFIDLERKDLYTYLKLYRNLSDKFILDNLDYLNYKSD